MLLSKITGQKSERWITIGTVSYGFSVIGNCGYPGVMSVTWRGRYVWCAPWQFLKGIELERAVHTRLRHYGLEAVAMATTIQERWPGSGRELRVLARRIMAGKGGRAGRGQCSQTCS